MEAQAFWFDFLSKQLPVIIVLGFFCYGMYKYFIEVVRRMEIKIDRQDEEIRELNETLRDLTVRCMEAINRNTDAFKLLNK